MIDSNYEFTIHNSWVGTIKERLLKIGWAVADLDEIEQKGKYLGQHVPDLIALTTENALVFIEYKKHLLNFGKYDSLNRQSLVRYSEYMNWIDATGIPLILVSAEGCWLVEP